MSEIPHIHIKREGSSRDGWCVHYAGFMNRLNTVTHCRAGVDYKTVQTHAPHTYSYGNEKHKYESPVAFPCFKREAHLAKTCDKCRFPTEDEIKARRDEMMAHINQVADARKAIVDSIGFPWKHGMPGSQGRIDCPVCKGFQTLGFSRAGYNGHIHAKCSTPNCVSWME